MRLLAGGVPPEEFEGSILLGGVALHDLEPAQARAVMLVEPHQTDLFTGTVAANVAGPAPADRTRLLEALAASAADEVVDGHPDGIDRHVAERGATLSGGQRQRLALARALLAHPPILVLHDPTTAVDAVTEQSIARAVRALRQERTTVVVTSSPAILAVADRVVVVDDGRVTVEGGHAELGATHDNYRKVVLR
ncbi:ABC transporter ATP-binding protein [Dactylosporangium cerinum]